MFARFRKAKTDRLHVSLVEAKRGNGSVRQEHIAALGSIRLMTAAARRDFWQQLEPRLARLANRLGDEGDRIRNQIAERIPNPSDGEIEVEAWIQVRRGFQGTIDREREQAQHALDRCRDWEKHFQPIVDDCDSNIRNVQRRVMQGDTSALAESAANRQEAIMALGQVLAARIGYDPNHPALRRGRYRTR
jgi:hypothetical protein